MPLILRTLAVCLLLACSVGFGRAADEGSPVALQTGQHLAGQFEHERRIAGFDVPLRSSGSMLLTRGGELIWRTEQPFVSQMVVTPNTIMQIVDGRHAMQIPTGAAGQVNELLVRVLTGDWAGLGFRQTGGPGSWSALGEGASLPEILAAQISEIRARGGRFVDEVTVTRKNGDVERFRFHDHAIRQDPLPEGDRALLERSQGG